MADVHYYKLIAGASHRQKDPDGQSRTYKKDDKIPSVINLAAKDPRKFAPTTPPRNDPYKSQPDKVHSEDIEKFERQQQLDEGSGSGPDNPHFETMTVAQLKEFAENEEIDLHGLRSKDEILAKVKEQYELNRGGDEGDE